MDFDSPDVAKDFPGLFASENMKRSQSRDSDYSDDEKTSRKDILGKKKERKESKKDKGYVVFEGESSGEEVEEAKSPDKSKKNKSGFTFRGKDKKEKHSKSKDGKEKKEEKEKVCKKESKESKKDAKDIDKVKVKKKKESKLLKIKDKKKKNIEQEVKEEKPIFGVPLQVAVEQSKSHDDIELPVIVRECIDYIEEHGLGCEGIYKISGLKSKVRNLKNQYNRGEKVYLYEHEPHIVASLLKQFLRDLPEPILTSGLIPKFEEAAALKNEQKKVETLQKLMNELPNCNRVLLSWIFIHMDHVIALERRNKMNLQNVSIALSPSLQISHNILQAFFTHSNILFRGVELKKYVPPIELDSSRLSLELPDSPSAIVEELSKQENVLNILHAELNTGLRDQQKEEQLWEIQRIVTQLKRKLRFLRQIQDTSNARSVDAHLEQKLSRQIDEITPKALEEEPSTSGVVTSTDDNISDITEQEKQMLTSNEANLPNSEHKEPLTEMVMSEECSNLENTSQGILKKECTEEKEYDEGDATLDDKKIAIDSVSSAVGAENISETKTTLIPANYVNVPQLTSVSKQAEDDSLHSLLVEERMYRIQADEMALLGDELRRKIFSERLEIERLKMEVNEYQQLYKYKRYSFDSTENSSSDSDDSSASDDDEEEEDLSVILDDLMVKNQQLEIRNKDLTKGIQIEREMCLNLKVQMKMLQMETKSIKP